MVVDGYCMSSRWLADGQLDCLPARRTAKQMGAMQDNSSKVRSPQTKPQLLSSFARPYAVSCSFAASVSILNACQRCACVFVATGAGRTFDSKKLCLKAAVE